MDHNEAVRLQAVEKYLLRELPPAQVEEYEEHYFDCSACAEELKAAVAFMESTRQVFREEAPQTVDNKRLVPTPGGWFGWLRPAFAIPVFAALLLFIGYQNGVTIPSLKHSTTAQTAQIFGASFHLPGSIRGGSEAGDSTAKVPVHRGEGFLLDFDFTPSRTFNSYKFQIQDESGRVVEHGVLGGDKTNQAVSLAVSGVDRAGKYNLVFFGDADNNQAGSAIEVLSLAFIVEFKQ